MHGDHHGPISDRIRAALKLDDEVGLAPPRESAIAAPGTIAAVKNSGGGIPHGRGPGRKKGEIECATSTGASADAS